MSDLSRARERMVDVQIACRFIRDRGVLEAMRRVPREAFVSPGYEEFAYEDGPLPIGEGQTISQPYIVALMIEAAEAAQRRIDNLGYDNIESSRDGRSRTSASSVASASAARQR